MQLQDLAPNPRNPRKITDKQLTMLRKSLGEFGDLSGIVFNRRSGKLVGAHQRLKVLPPEAEIIMDTEDYGHVDVEGDRFQVRLVDWDEIKEKAANIAANKHGGSWDIPMLNDWLIELEAANIDMDLTGFENDELAGLLSPTGTGEGGETGAGSLAERFLIPPFTVLNAREGWWQDRKRAWLAMGIKSELGRGDNLLSVSESQYEYMYNKKNYTGQGDQKSKFGKCLETGIGAKYGREEMTGTSIFDPVLCELSYRWFSPTGGLVLDPFAGGSVRGLVAAKLGRQYIGNDLRAEQVEANRAQVDEVLDEKDPTPVWHCGDSRDIADICKGVQADFIFSCPPYADLEVYSEDPADLSTLDYAEFRDAYFEIIRKSCSLLKNDRFAAFIVGEVRDKTGAYYNFVGDTVEAFRAAGLAFYNEAILVTAVGSLPIRAGKAFSATRKLGKTHQNVLVFVKGDPKRATTACGLVEIDDSMFATEEQATEAVEE